jgi:hypothetical protein
VPGDLDVREHPRCYAGREAHKLLARGGLEPRDAFPRGTVDALARVRGDDGQRPVDERRSTSAAPRARTSPSG